MFAGKNRAARLAALVLIAALPAAAQVLPVTRFYPLVDSLCTFPPADRQLEIICQKKVERWHITFVGIKGEKRVLLAAATFEPVTDPKSISLTVDFENMKPTTGKVPTWGYVFDRDADGQLDYMALVEGAAPFKDRNFPSDFPLRDQTPTRQQLEYYIGHCRLVFNHYADDNFDNYIDAIVHIDLDPRRDWVERRVFARSGSFTDKFDEAWAFPARIDGPRQELTFTPGAVPIHPLDNPNSELTATTLGSRTAILQLFNKAAKACGLTPSSFVRLGRRD